MIRSDSSRDIDLTRNMTKRLCEASSIASLHCHSGCIIKCRPISVLAVFQGAAVQGSSFLGWTKWTQLLLDWTGLDWEVQGCPAFPSSLYSTFLLFFCVFWTETS